MKRIRIAKAIILSSLEFALAMLQNINYSLEVGANYPSKPELIIYPAGDAKSFGGIRTIGSNSFGLISSAINEPTMLGH